MDDAFEVPNRRYTADQKWHLGRFLTIINRRLLRFAGVRQYIGQCSYVYLDRSTFSILQ